MIRQLPKLALPKFIQNHSGSSQDLVQVNTEATDVKIYDVITPATVNNSEGNSMQLQLFHMDSEVNEGVRELHGRIVLTTESLPDKQDLKFGFMFSNDSKDGKYDGLQVTTKVDTLYQHSQFEHADISVTGDKPNIFELSSDVLSSDKQNDWVLLPETSQVVCEDVGRCEISVDFVRNFNTLDKTGDIALQVGKEAEYSLFGFYEAAEQATGRLTHRGQSQDQFVFMGATNAMTSSVLAAATALAALTAF